MSGHLDTLEAACRAADAKRAASGDELRLNREAPQATIEALMYGLREGIAALRTRPDRLRRLSELSEGQLRVVCKRLVNFKPHIAPGWTEEAVRALVKIWSGGHANK
jgi:hypothetical protein